MNKNNFPRMHVSFYVSDINKTVAFYSSFFGQEPEKVKEKYAKYILENPSLIISFVENKKRVHKNLGHYGFQVETLEEMNQRMKEAEEKGLISKVEMGTACCYAKQDKFWVNDPDGIQWEVYYFHEDVEFNDPHYEMRDTEACCIPISEEQKQETGACCVPLNKKEGQTACC